MIVAKRNASEAHDYVLGLIEAASQNFGLRFFITSRDFDRLFRWWEKGIPEKLVLEAIGRVAARKRKKNESLKSFFSCDNEVKKLFAALREAGVGQVSSPQPQAGMLRDEIGEFFKRPSPELSPFMEKFRLLADAAPDCRSALSRELQEEILRAYENDLELQVQTEMFLRQLAPELQRPDLIRCFKIRFLHKKLGLPGFLLNPERPVNPGTSTTGS